MNEGSNPFFQIVNFLNRPFSIIFAEMLVIFYEGFRIKSGSNLC